MWGDKDPNWVKGLGIDEGCEKLRKAVDVAYKLLIEIHPIMEFEKLPIVIIGTKGSIY